MNILEQQLSQTREASKNRIKPEALVQMREATTNLKNTDIERVAFNVGANIGDAILLDHWKNDISLKEYLNNRPCIISFYRGTWCPYCNLELKVYNELLSKEPKVTMVAISPEMPKSGLDIEHLNFAVFSDIDNTFAKKLNLTFKLSETLEAVYKGIGIDLEKSQGNQESLLPLPATYIVDASGMIVYAYLEADYTKRAEPQEVIKLYKKLFKL